MDGVKRLNAVEAENARLRKLLVERDLEIEVMNHNGAFAVLKGRPNMGFWIRRVCIALATLIVVAVCALFAFILSFNADAYKSDLQLLVKERTNRELTIAGELKVELFPKLAVRARQVSLSEEGRADRFASIDDLWASMAIWPLFKNQIIVDELAASGIRANLIRTRDGKLSIDDLVRWLNWDDAPSDAPDSLLATNDMTIDVAGIQIKDAEITLHDERRQTTWDITGMSLSTGQILRDSPVDVNLEATIRKAGIPEGSKITAKALVAVNLEPWRVDAWDLVVLATGDWPGAVWQPEPVSGLEVVVRAPYLGIDAENSRLRVERLAVRAKGQREGNPLEFALDVSSFERTAHSVSAGAFTSRLRVDGARTLDLSLLGVGLTGSPQAWSLARLDSTLTTKRESRSTRSFLSSPVQVQMQPLAISLADIRGDVKMALVDSKIGERSVAVKGNLALAMSGKSKDPQPLSIRGRVESIPFAAAWTGIDVESPLDGVASLDVDLKAADGPWAKLEDTVAGTVQLKIEQAAIRGIDFTEGLDALRAIAKPSAVGVRFKGDPAKRTAFDNVEIGMRVAGTMASITRLDMSGSNWRVALGKPAEVNLRDGTADLGVILHLLGPQRITAGKVTVEVRSLVVPLRLTGALNNPYVNIDWKDLERDRLGKALRQKLIDWDDKASGVAGTKARPH